MSNHTSPRCPEEDITTGNISHLLQIICAVGLMVSSLLLVSKFDGKSEDKTPNSRKTIIHALVDKSDTFQGLPIIRIGNPEEIHTLKSSGKHGWYVFQEGNIITYWKIRSGIIESNTYTLTQ